MITLEDAVIARLEYFGEHFEIPVDPRWPQILRGVKQ